MSGIVAILVERGLVVRAGPGGKGRPAHVDLSGRGRELIGRAWPAFAAINAPDRLGLDVEQLRRLNTDLTTLRELPELPGPHSSPDPSPPQAD